MRRQRGNRDPERQDQGLVTRRGRARASEMGRAALLCGCAGTQPALCAGDSLHFTLALCAGDSPHFTISYTARCKHSALRAPCSQRFTPESGALRPTLMPEASHFTTTPQEHRGDRPFSTPGPCELMRRKSTHSHARRAENAQMHFCSDAQMPRSVKTASAVLTDRVPKP